MGWLFLTMLALFAHRGSFCSASRSRSSLHRATSSRSCSNLPPLVRAFSLNLPQRLLGLLNKVETASNAVASRNVRW